MGVVLVGFFLVNIYLLLIALLSYVCIYLCRFYSKLSGELNMQEKKKNM